jgi:hypothetical protein
MFERDLHTSYESLRAEALTCSKDKSTQSLGRALFCSRGMAGWIEVWSAISPALPHKAPETHIESPPIITQIPEDFKAQLATLLAHTVMLVQKEAALC